MARAAAQEADDPAQVVGGAVGVQGANSLLAASHLRQPLRQPCNRAHEVGDARRDGVLRHGREVGFGRLLHHDHAGRLLDRAHAHRAVGAGAGQDHGHAVAAGGRNGAEEDVDRRAPSPRLVKRPRTQIVTLDHQFPVRRDHEYAIRLQLRAVGHLQHVHARAGR